MNPSSPCVAVCFWRLGPYHHARLRAAGRVMRIEAVEFVGRDSDYAWDRVEGAQGFGRTTLQEAYDGSPAARQAAAQRMEAELSRLQPDVVAVPGWSLPDALMALRWCVRHRRPAVLMSESTAGDERRHPAKEAIKSRIVHLFSAALVGGARHREYVAELGMPAEAVWLGYDAVDNDHFQGGARTVRTSERDSGETPYFLASARFIEKKNLPVLLRAYARHLEAGGAWAPGGKPDGGWPLVILGDGPLRGHLERLIDELGLQEAVRLPGFVQYPDLPAHYARAGAFVHASTSEQWGLVVNEAMAGGLPVLVSNRCGCAPDLVQEGVNGWTFDPSDEAALASLMRRMEALPPADRHAMGTASERWIADWGPHRFAEGLRQAVMHAVRVGPPRSGLIDGLVLSALSRR